MNNFTKAFYTTKSKSIKWVFAVLALFLLGSQYSFGQTTVFSDDFSSNSSATYVTSGAINTTAWSVTRSGADWGVRRNTSPAQMEITNDVGATANTAGWGFSSIPVSNFSSPYTSTLSSNPGDVTWNFNMRQIRATAGGFGVGSYGAAMVLGCTSTTVNSAGTGYAVTIGASGFIRLVRFNNGLAGTQTNIIAGSTNAGTNYYSFRVIYTPSTNTWQLLARNDGASAFADPASGSLTAVNTATVDNTYTGSALANFGAYWQGSTTANQTAFFDNVSVTVVSAGPTITLAQLTTGIAPSPLAASSTNKAVLGFSATSSAGTPSMTAFNIGTSTTSVNKFTNVKLYTSTDNSYATAGDNTQITGFTFAQTATQLQFSALTEALSTSAKYYFIVADIDATVTGATVAVQPSLTNANVTVSSGSVTGGTITGTNYAFDVAAGTPSISPSGTLAAVNTTYGTASGTPTSFTVSGASLTDDIVITPPAGFEISKTVGGASGYASTQTLTQSGGTVSSTTIYVRLANTTAFGTYSGNITLVSTGDGLSVNVATASSTVSKKALTISGLSLVAASKVYDATTTAAITGTAALQAATTLALNTSGDGKPIDTDTVSLTGTAVGTYNSKDVATATTVSYSGLSLTGASAANYSLTAHATSAATITAKPITLSGLTVPASKVYNGTTAAVVTGSPGTLAAAIAPGTGTAIDGIRYTGDTATLTGTAVGTYNSANVATATTVTFTGVSLTGAQAGNYSLTAHPSQAATITKATAVITFGALAAKTTADVPFPLTATSTSGNTVTYVSGTPATATISGSTVTIVAAGSTVITASDAGNANYDAAVDVPQTLTVTAGPIWSNPITTGSNVWGFGNPFTSGQTVVPNLTVFGIGLVGATATSGNSRANSSNWPTVASIDLTKYFEFILTPSPGYEIDFTNFIYTSTLSSGTPTIVMRSSVDSFGADIATLSTTGATVNLSTFQNITSAITFRVYVYNMPTTGATWSINDFQFNGEVVLGTPVPEMNVTQGGSIASGGTNAFGNQENGTSGSAVTFTIQNTGNAVLNLSGTPNKVAITGNTADFVINETATTATVAATSGTTTFTVTFSPQAVGARAAQLSIANDDSNENPYLINLTGTGTTSQQSTIAAASFTAPSNVAYGSYRANDITSGNSLEVGQFTIQDGASDNDSFGTILNTVTLSLTNPANIRRVAIYDGSTELQEIAAGATNTFNAPALASNLFTTDGGSKTFSIRVTFNDTVTDNQQYQFTVTGATADAAGSGFATVGGSTSIAGNNNRIVVTANRLSFGTVGGGSINVTLPSFTLSATDGLGNVDLDRSAAVTLGTTSAFPSANFTRTTPTYALTGGSITISDVAFADAQTTTLTADAAGLTQGVSNPFIISLVSFPANSYRTTSAGAYPSGATWERFVSGTWTSGFTPVAGEDDFIYIRHAITNASNSPQNVVIETGGTFTYNSSATNLSSLLVESGGVLQINAALTVSGTFTVESGGTVNINSSTTNGASALWNGVEDFQDGSTVNIQNWQYADANRLIENPSRIQVNTTSGSYFGNLIVSGNPPTGDSFIVVDGAPTINLCKNNFTVSEAGTGYVAITSSGANATIGGNVIVTTGQFNVAATTSGNAITTVLGNISVASGGTLNLNVNSSGSATSIVQLKGNLSVVSGGTLNSTDTGCAVVFSGTTGTQTLSLAGTLGTNANFEVGDGTNASTVELINQNLNLTNSSNAFTVKTNGILDFNYRDITGIGTFTLESAGELRITSAAGLTASGATGNVTSSGTRTISQSGIFRYTGNVTPQATGNAMTTGSSAKRIIIDKTNPTDVVNLTQSTGTTDRLEIIEGTFVETAAANVSGSGNLVMSGGTYRTAVVSGPVPLLAGTFTLTGGTIDLNAAGNQTLKGARDYRNLTFSTSGTKTLSSAPNSVTGTATVQSGVILDVDNNSFGDSNTNLTLNGTAIYKTSGNGTKPDADGTYNLAATSTVEFYGTSATIVKLGSPAVSYGNVVVSGTNVSSTSTTTGILFKSGGSFTVKQGATFTFRQPGGLNGLVNSAVSSTNSPTVTIENTPALSTIVYNGVGQTLTGRADYGNLTINNTSGALTTSGDVTVSGTLTLTRGIITTGANTIAVTNDTTPISGGSSIAYVSGKLRLTYPATGTNVARTFPIGKGAAYRPVTFTYDSNPGSRTVLLEQFETGFPGALPSTASQFGTRYWNITQSSVGASYKVTLDAGPATTSGTVVMIRREGTGASTSNEVTTPNYTNVTSYNTTDISNDVSFGECTVCSFIMPAQCGSTLPDINTTIYCYGITGATDYRFKVTKAGTDYIFDNDLKNIRAFVLSQIPGVASYSTTYGVSVSAFIGGVWQAYGRVCTITTPPNITVNTTQIMLNRCGTTLPTLNTTIYANAVVGATQYRFEVTGGSFGVRTVDSPYRYFTLSQLLPGGGEYSKTYSIRVAINNGIWQGYGPACNVSTPAAPAPRMAAQDINTNVFEVKAFPNPFARHFSLDIQSSSDYLVQVKVYDMIGRELEVQKATVSELSTKEIGTNYPSGVYNVVVSQGDKVKSVRMIKR